MVQIYQYLDLKLDANMIRSTLDNRILILTLDAEAKNAMSAEDLRLLAQLIGQYNASAEVDGIILTGANQSFCSGLAYNPQLDKDAQLAELFPALEDALLAMAQSDLPLVCVAGGHAIGAGFLMLGAADAVFMTANPKAKFGLPEVMLDLYVSPVMVEVLRMRFEEAHIRRLLFGGSYVSSSQLEQWGVVDAISEDENDLTEKAKAYITRMAPHKESVKKCKQVLQRKKDESE